MSSAVLTTVPASRPARRRRVRAGVLAAVLALLVPVLAVPGALAGPGCLLTGDGDEDKPYQVANATHLALVGVGDCGLDAHYLQMGDIALDPPTGNDTSNHTPIGTPSAPFTGVYDGGTFTIEDIYLEENASTVGFFGAVDGAEIRRVNLTVIITGGNGDDSGGLIGRVIRNSASDPTVITDSSVRAGINLPSGGRVGALIGEALNAVQIENVVVSAAIRGRSTIGGLVGHSNEGLTVKNASLPMVVITAEQDANLGGLVGESKGDLVEVSDVSVTALLELSDPRFSTNYVGGLFGEASATKTTIDDVDVTVHIDTEARSVGGLVGYIDGSYELSITNAVVDPIDLDDELLDSFVSDLGLDLPDDVVISGTDRVGGAIGSINGSSSTSTHDVSIEGTVVNVPLIATTGTAIGCLVGIEAPGGTLTTVGSFSTSTFTDKDDVTTDCLEDALVPAFGAVTSTADGFTVPVSNFDADFTWAATVTAGAASVAGGVLTVSGLGAGVEATATVTATRGGYREGSASVTGSALAADSGTNTGTTPGTNDGTNTGSDSGAGSGGERSFVAPGGVVPSVPAGSGVWQTADGTIVPLTVSSPGENQVRYEADGVRVTFTGAAGTDASAGLVADPNGEVVCEICVALAAGLPLDVWLFSTPRLLGTHVTENLPCQTFTVSMVEPADGEGPVVGGAHTLQLAVPSAAGVQAVNVGVTVGGPVPTVVPSGEGPAVPSGLLVFGLLAAAGALAVRRQAAGGVQAG